LIGLHHRRLGNKIVSTAHYHAVLPRDTALGQDGNMVCEFCRRGPETSGEARSICEGNLLAS
jgi:hypothetical protein